MTTEFTLFQLSLNPTSLFDHRSPLHQADNSLPFQSSLNLRSSRQFFNHPSILILFSFNHSTKQKFAQWNLKILHITKQTKYTKTKYCQVSYSQECFFWLTPGFIKRFLIIYWDDVFLWYLSRLMTKPTKWLCTQWRLRSALVSAQSDQSLHCALNG